MADGFWKRLGKKQQQVQTGPSVQDFKTLLTQYGIDVVVTPQGELVPMPAGATESEVRSFAERWQSISENLGATATNRDLRLKAYEQMDASGGEPSIVLDTYADEVVSIVDYSEASLQISISDEKLRKKVFQVLRRNKVLDSLRSDIRSMCQDGDFAYALTDRKGERLVELTLNAAKSGNAFANPYSPEDLLVHPLSASQYELEADLQEAWKLIPGQGASFLKEKSVYPWEFALFSIPDRRTFPYGLSQLEKMREPWDKLRVLEELLAVTRANKMDRIAFTVPGLKGDPSSVMNRLSQVKNSIKNIILGHGSTDRISRNKDTGMTEWLWMPEGYEVKRLSTSIDVSSTEDVEYFRDKLINASRLPKGFFLASEAGQTPRPMSLRQQDIKFARSLIPIGEAYCRGLEKLLYLISFYLGAQLNSLNIRVTFKKSPYLAEELVNTYDGVYNIIEKYLTLRSLAGLPAPLTDVDLKRILDLVGAPHALLLPEETGARRESLKEDLQKVYKINTVWDVARYEAEG